jgi:P-type E1-E2 ATPase
MAEPHVDVAVATGTDTELGRISTMLGAVEALETPLTRDLNRFGRTVTGAIAALALVVAGIAAARGFAAVEAAMAGISLAVAAVPEGLPTAVTIALAVGACGPCRCRPR